MIMEQDSDMKKKLGVIILNWNGRELLERLLAIVERHTQSDQSDLIVADNGSTDDSVAYIKEHFPGIRIIEFDENYGFAEGYNRAVEICADDYEYVTLLNSDVETTEGWWQPIVKFLDSHKDVGAVQPKIIDWRNRTRFEYAGAAGGYLDALGYPFCRGRLFDCIEEDYGQYDTEAKDIAWASGACLTMPAALYKEVGGLDADFFAHMEEIDLCCRIHAAGRRVCALSCTKVYHIGGASLDASNPKKTYLNFRNNLLLLHKNLPKSRGKKIIFLRRLADTLAFMMFIVKGEGSQAKAILKAHSDFRKMRSKYTSQPTEDYLKSLPGADKWAVWERYVKRKRKIEI